ncbi:hypothetical protein SARC_05881 [Sphaeroforma arctica JP610]|uniref:Uncharacterized protein n=1 Tax=Sphaeroforma arctica JP610 TaxID=667725 RepID=A0A0L0FYA9_9EUKA|nr:hypothetical protein SARC_05881 [Sphaeroforma arctica JP610]KNC81817.1 hypothetical protein SARC_05881 [Sphaeroforma arctica JP610]|eukprot:XP_014155719.1 hypothetical protein SARC_05881 [Sphaeroforma arctica JP610]
MEVCADYILKLVNCVVRGDDLIKGLRHIGEVELYERLSNVLELSKLAADEPRVPMAKPHDEQLTASLKELVTEITMASVRMAGAVRYMASKPAKSHERYTRPLATPMLEVAHQCSALLRSYSTALREGQLIAKKDASLSKRQGDLDEGPLQSAYRALRAYHKQSSSNNLLALENELLDEHWVHPATLAFMLNLESIVEMVSAIDSFRIQ